MKNKEINFSLFIYVKSNVLDLLAYDKKQTKEKNGRLLLEEDYSNEKVKNRKNKEEKPLKPNEFNSRRKTNHL